MKRILSTATVAALTVALAACSGGQDDASSRPVPQRPSASAAPEPAESTPEPTAEQTPEPTPEPTAAASGNYTYPDWANPPSDSGVLLGTLLAGGVTIDVYKVGEGTAKSDGIMIDPRTNELVLAAGDPVVALHYVLTNTGSAPLVIGSIPVFASERYTNSPYLGSAIQDFNEDWLAELGVFERSTKAGGYSETNTYPIAPGESVATTRIIELHPDTLEIEARVTPVDAAGNLQSDASIVAPKVTVTLNP